MEVMDSPIYASDKAKNYLNTLYYIIFLYSQLHLSNSVWLATFFWRQYTMVDCQHSHIVNFPSEKICSMKGWHNISNDGIYNPEKEKKCLTLCTFSSAVLPTSRWLSVLHAFVCLFKDHYLVDKPVALLTRRETSSCLDNKQPGFLSCCSSH
jgi:hypothetical protein